VCGLRICAVKNSMKRTPARSPECATIAGMVTDEEMGTNPAIPSVSRATGIEQPPDVPQGFEAPSSPRSG
jgi:hypothetical protein